MYKINIKDRVDSKFKNLNQFAMACKMQRVSVDKIYQGTTTRVSLDVLESMCDVLDCTPNDILTEYIDNKWIPISQITPEQRLEKIKLINGTRIISKPSNKQNDFDSLETLPQRRFIESMSGLDKETIMSILLSACDIADDLRTANGNSDNNNHENDSQPTKSDSGDAK